MYDDLPVLKAVSPEKVEGLNDRQTWFAKKVYAQAGFNATRSMRSGGLLSQDKPDDLGRSTYRFTDKKTAPRDIQHSLKHKSAFSENKHKMGYDKYLTQTETNTDDEFGQ